MTRRDAVTTAGLAGAGLGVAAGLVQTFAGARIPEWTGGKADPVPLGLLTVALAAVAGAAALAQRRARGSGARAACAAALLVPALLCLSTAGRLWYLPAILLTAAAIGCVEGWRATGAAVAHARWRVLLGVLGGCELLMAAGAAPRVLAVGAVGGLVLVAAAAAARRRATLGAGLLLGTVPFAALAWTALVPIALVPTALAVSAPLLRAPSAR